MNFFVNTNFMGRDSDIISAPLGNIDASVIIIYVLSGVSTIAANGVVWGINYVK